MMKYNLEEEKCEVGQAYVKLWTIRMCALGFGLRGNNRKYLSHLSAVNDSLLTTMKRIEEDPLMLCYVREAPFSLSPPPFGHCPFGGGV